MEYWLPIKSPPKEIGLYPVKSVHGQDLTAVWTGFGWRGNGRFGEVEFYQATIIETPPSYYNIRWYGKDYVQIENVPSELYKTTHACGNPERALKTGWLPCGDGCDYELDVSDLIAIGKYLQSLQPIPEAV